MAIFFSEANLPIDLHSLKKGDHPLPPPWKKEGSYAWS